MGDFSAPTPPQNLDVIFTCPLTCVDSLEMKTHLHYYFRVSDSIQERQHLLLSATQSDPVDTRPSDAKNGPSNRHPQFAMPMSKPVLLREQCGNKDSVVGAKKHQQPRRLEEELAFGEIQWTQVITYMYVICLIRLIIHFWAAHYLLQLSPKVHITYARTCICRIQISFRSIKYESILGA